ncbi:hypothetical protein EYZ11_003689 [Aspergillus tanneri]|uniref:Uncharacterized protein n=1 Tax=Aspergillus tanneri TaxID=1220188 RepID=A0A4S3JN07_9EURO|nr:hypothetical protein EYZ11_003689 [Aspergillus tanneri]
MISIPANVVRSSAGWPHDSNFTFALEHIHASNDTLDDLALAGTTLSSNIQQSLLPIDFNRSSEGFNRSPSFSPVNDMS